MAKVSLILSFLLISAAGSAFGATADFAFFNKLGLLIALNVALGGMLAFCAFVLASHLWQKVRGTQRPRHDRQHERTHLPNQGHREGSAIRNAAQKN